MYLRLVPSFRRISHLPKVDWRGGAFSQSTERTNRCARHCPVSGNARKTHISYMIELRTNSPSRWQ